MTRRTGAGSSKRHREFSLGQVIGQAVMHIILGTVSLSSVLPFVWMVFTSFKSYKETVSSRALIPQVWTLDNYVRILERVGFAEAFRNSVLAAVPVTLVTVLTSTAVAYVFAKYEFWKKELFFTAILATMMVPFSVVLVPLFVTISDLGMNNKLAGIIVTGFWSTFGIFLMRQSIMTIPNDYIEAARIDGASEFWVLRQVIIPLSTAPMSALAVFTFLGNWDSFMWPAVVLTSPATKTLPLVLAGLRGLYSNRYNYYATGSMLTVVPVMILYAVAQKQFIRGIAMTGIKG